MTGVGGRPQTNIPPNVPTKTSPHPPPLPLHLSENSKGSWEKVWGEFARAVSARVVWVHSQAHITGSHIHFWVFLQPSQSQKGTRSLRERKWCANGCQAGDWQTTAAPVQTASSAVLCSLRSVNQPASQSTAILSLLPLLFSSAGSSAVVLKACTTRSLKPRDKCSGVPLGTSRLSLAWPWPA